MSPAKTESPALAILAVEMKRVEEIAAWNRENGAVSADAEFPMLGKVRINQWGNYRPI